MLFRPDHENRFERLAGRIRLAEAPSLKLLTKIVAGTCARTPLLNKAGADALQFDRLVKASAWTDLALALIAIELPGWKLRRLVYDDGAWFCSLSTSINVPIALDDAAEASHENMTLAIFSAFVEARRRSTECAPQVQTVPPIRPAEGLTLCCDNFA